MADSFQPRTPFHFRVRFSGSSRRSGMGFSEISGFSQDRVPDAISEGGENRFLHRLPGAIDRGDLTCRRGKATGADDTFKWCRSILESDLSEAISPRDLSIDLLSEGGKALISWTVASAYPVKWTVSMLGEENDRDVAIEVLGFAFSSINRAT